MACQLLGLARYAKHLEFHYRMPDSLCNGDIIDQYQEKTFPNKWATLVARMHEIRIVLKIQSI